MQTSGTANTIPKCQYCGSAFPHQGICPTVKAIEYYPDGTMKRVELKTANDFPPLPHVEWRLKC